MWHLPDPSEKPRFVSAMFGRIAARYDFMNTLMTLGQDEAWRRAVARSIGSPRSVLDVGTGTAKLAAAITREHPRARVVGADFSLPMLWASGGGMRLVAADALRLPFGEGAFDAVTSAFLVRNLADLKEGIQEQARVLKPGGKLAILETTPGPRGWLRPFFHAYFRGAVPVLGRLLAGDPQAYTYLPASSAAFAEPEELATVLRTNGFEQIEIRRLALGCVALVQARRLSL